MAGGKFRKAKWIWESAAGSEADAIRAEYGVGRDMAAVIQEKAPCDTDPEVQRFSAGSSNNSRSRCAISYTAFG